MTAWHIEGTRRAIGRVYGRRQLELAKPCLRSLDDRQFYARFHYQRALSTLKRYIRTNLNDKDFFPISLGADEPEWGRFNFMLRKVAADMTACIQSLHSLPDILASATYYSLALDRTLKPENGRFVNCAFLTRSLEKRDDLRRVSDGLRAATKGPAYKHLAALANQSKHSNIVFPALNCDMTGERAEQYMLIFPHFVARAAAYPQVYVNEFLPPIYRQVSEAILETGHAIHAHLQSAA